MQIIDGNEAHDRGFANGTWELTIVDKQWECKSPKYGSVKYAVVADGDGKPLYDRPIYHEAPHVITVPWGRDEGGEIQIGLILEERPHGGGPFWGVPRGFRRPAETPEAAARREAGEEAGADVIIKSILGGYINPNPTFVGTNGPVVFLETNLARLGQIKSGRNEKIYKAEFLYPKTVLAMMRKGDAMQDGVSLAALMLFFASRPQQLLL